MDTSKIRKVKMARGSGVLSSHLGPLTKDQIDVYDGTWIEYAQDSQFIYYERVLPAWCKNQKIVPVSNYPWDWKEYGYSKVGVSLRKAG